MQTARIGEWQLSRLMLGTVQFGLNYGIANRRGQPSYAEVRDILACALDAGVNCLDTAAAYGESEEVLGRALVDLDAAGRVLVVTKVRHLAPAQLSAREAEARIEASVRESLSRLRLEALPLCLFHIEEDFRYAEALLRLKERGLVRHIGASVMTPEATAAILDSGLADAIQVPANLLDQRFTRTGLLARARAAGVAVFARSLYLQGLLHLPEAEIPEALAPVIPIRRRLQALAAERGTTLAALAVRYVLGLDGVCCGVIGVDSVAQMRENVALFSQPPLDDETMAAVAALVPPIPDRVILPMHWAKP